MMKINNLSLIKATGKIGNQFVGIKISNNRIEFHYPETYNLSENDPDLRKELMAILKTISLAKTVSNESSSYNTTHKKDFIFPLQGYLWIINDFLTYGKYQDYEKRFVNGVKGRINWKKTMKSCPSISNGSVVYSTIISELKTKEDNLLTEIYNYCVQKSMEAIGWLYNLKFDSNGINYYRLFNKRKYLGAINTELGHSFEDTKIQRLSYMKSIILGLDDKNTNVKDFIYGVDSYDYIYERLVDRFFHGIKNISDFYPKATWHLDFEGDSFDSSNLRPDTVLVRPEIIKENGIVKEKNNVYILDAKYYRFGTTFLHKDLPETSSVQKQITYGDLVKLLYRYIGDRADNNHYDDVYNAFIMPYNKFENQKKDKLNKDIEYIGVATAKWNEQNKGHQKIVGILIDTKFLIDNWMRQNNEAIDILTHLIEEKTSLHY